MKHVLDDFLTQTKKGLIVSCQALPHEPLHGAEIMARMAVAAAEGGACGIRANTPQDIAAIRRAVDLPIVGLYKEEIPGFPVYITPTLDHAIAIAEAGATVIAIDATNRERPSGSLATFIAQIHKETGCPVMADISTFEEGVGVAVASGADLVATTMSGYTPYSPQMKLPDLELVGQLAAAIEQPVIAEGRYNTPELVRDALARGAHTAVVGGAITRPQEITKRFVDMLT